MATNKALAQRRSPAELEKLKDAITAWKLTPPERRDPPTIRGLAKRLGEPKSTISYYASKTPDCVADVIEEAEKNMLNRWPRIMRVLGERAEEGDPEAARLLMREVVPHYRRQRESGSDAYQPALTKVTALLPRGAAIAIGSTAPAEPSTGVQDKAQIEAQNGGSGQICPTPSR